MRGYKRARDLALYCINRPNTRQLEIGQTYQSGPNPLYCGLMTGSIRNITESNHLSRGLVAALEEGVASAIPLAMDALVFQSMLIRELVFEETRRIEFPTTPSRLTSFFLSDKSQVLAWHQVMGGRVLEIRLTGKYHVGDNYWLVDGPELSALEIQTRAISYFLGKRGPENETMPEIIAQGQLRIARECALDEFDRGE